jgi:hypothetical protein
MLVSLMRRSVFRLVRNQEYQDRDKGTGSLHFSGSLASQVCSGALLTVLYNVPHPHVRPRRP